MSDSSAYELKVDQELAPGVQWKSYRFSDIFETKQVINVIEVDLKKAKVKPVKSKSCNELSNIASSTEAIAAVNGTFFNEDCLSRNYLKIDGETSSKNIIRKAGSVALLIKKDGTVQMKKISKKADPKIALHGIGGFPQLISGGGVKISPIESTPFFESRHPRTAVAIDGHNKVFFFTIDGRSSKSEGFTLFELADFLHSYGVTAAMNLDGGGSSTMWLEEAGVVNDPSDLFGQREIADGLAVFSK